MSVWRSRRGTSEAGDGDRSEDSVGQTAAGSDTDTLGERTHYQRVQYSNVDTEALEIARKESREVLAEQLRILRGLDDKAMRTVRTSVLVIGLGVSAVQISGFSASDASSSGSVVFWGVSGAIFLLVSILVGSVTYSASDPSLGVSDDHRRDVVDGEFTERQWLAFQLDEYDEWTENMQWMIDRNVVGLNLTLVTSTFGVASLLIAAVFASAVDIGDLVLPTLLSLTVTSVLAAVSWLFSVSAR